MFGVEEECVVIVEGTDVAVLDDFVIDILEICFVVVLIGAEYPTINNKIMML